MTHMKHIAMTLATVVVLVSHTGLAQSGHDLFQKALAVERADGDVKAAVQLYEQIVKQFEKSDRALAAKALVQLGAAYEKLGSEEAKKRYERVTREFVDQKEAAAVAAQRLAALTQPASAPTVAEHKVLSGKDLSELGASITRDGRFLVYAADGMDAPSIRDMATGQVTHLGRPGTGVTMYDMYLSDDHKQVVYSWLSDSEWQLRVLPAQPGAKPRLLIRPTDEITRFVPRAWSPDGKWLIVEMQHADSTWQFARVSVPDGQLTVLESTNWRRGLGPGRMRTSLSPDGRFFVYAAYAVNPSKAQIQPTDPQDTHIYALATDGSGKSEVAKSVGHNEDPVWSADGSHVLFLSDRARTFDLWAVPVENGRTRGNPFHIKRNIGTLANVIPIGTTTAGVYYYTSFPGLFNQISIADLETTGSSLAAKTLTRLDGGIGTRPEWSPDGKRLAFVAPPEAIVVRTMSTGEERRYRTQARMGSQAVWFHRSDALLTAVDYPAEPRGRNRALGKIDLATGDFQEIAAVGRYAGRAAFIGALSPDDKTLYVKGEVIRDPPAVAGDPTSGSPSLDRITAIDIETGQQRTVLTGPLLDFRLSPDGQTLAFKRPHPGGLFSVVVADVTGTDVREVSGPYTNADTFFKLAWTPDSSHILFSYVEQRIPRILRVSRGGGKPIPVELPLDNRVEAFDLSPDGAHLALSIMESGEVELWAIHTTPLISAATPKKR